MATIQSSDLDFNTIKNSLKTYFQQQSEFADYNFEASGLSNILDVLAYNTHLNGLIANIGINESFLQSSQLRSSVVSHAENLGYYPRSKTGSSIDVNISVSTSDTTTASATLARNTIFTGSSDQVTYNFQTLEEYTALNDGSGNFVFKTSAGSTSIPIKEGTQRTKTFLVGETTENQVYVIPDENLDTTTFKVEVFDTATSSTFTTYTNVNNAVRIDSTSTVYIVREVPNGYYELIFSDGTILGQAPQAGNKIVVSYLAPSGSASNEISTFEAASLITINSVNYNVTVTTPTGTSSSGGSEKESIDSIKLNAPIGFATQQRMVTAEDYKATILENYSSVLDDVAAWGGNENIPPVFGRVYVSLKFKTGINDSIKTSTKNGIITNLTDNLAIMSIDTVYSDPETTFLQIITTFNFDPDQTNLTAQATETLVENTVKSYVEDNLDRFDSVFRRSNLLSTIDDLSPAILNSKMEVKMQQRFTPTLNTTADYTISFPAAIASPDDETRKITSSRFTYDGTNSSIVNKLDDVSSNLQIINATTEEVLVDNIGNYNASRGTVTLSGFNISAFSGDSIKISAVPANQSTIRPLRSYILSLDESTSAANAVIDYQNTLATISTWHIL